MGGLVRTPSALAVANGFVYIPLYVERSNPELQIIDARDSARSSIISTIPLTASPTNIVVTEIYAYLGSRTTQNGTSTNGIIQLLDVSDPHNVVPLSSFADLTTVNDFQVVGNRIYVADGDAGLQILEVDLPQQAYQMFLPVVAR